MRVTCLLTPNLVDKHAWATIVPIQDLVDAYWTADGKTLPTLTSIDQRINDYKALDTEVKAIQNAGIEAAKVPLSNALLNKKVNEIGKKLLEKSNPACITDLQAGVDLSHIGINMGKSNVKANLPLIKDEKIVKNFKKEIENL